ncbi:UNVERIFIED_CONTAM: hypothetical protein HDU68_012334 [Siphonaria sp. JEL0065]|nr:hypothetical protein HDU68_012334 [Siphonaria sp. JEL0065]
MRRSKRLKPSTPEPEREPFDDTPLFSDQDEDEEEDDVYSGKGEADDEEDEDVDEEMDVVEPHDHCELEQHEHDEHDHQQDLNTLPFLNLTLKVDHVLRPIVADEKGRLFLEAFSPIAEQAVDFLVAVAEPVSRPKLIHEYVLTEYSLYAAVSVGIQADSIIHVLNKLCKTDIPEKLISFIRLHTKSYGKVKLVLKDNHQFVESAYPDVLRQLLQDKVIADARVVIPTVPSGSMNLDPDSDDVVVVDQVDGFTTRVQTFEPVTFTRPALAPGPSSRGRPSSTASAPVVPRKNIAPAYASAAAVASASTASSAISQPSGISSATSASIEKDYIDLFDEDENDPFDSIEDPFENIDPEEFERLKQILDGHAPKEPLDTSNLESESIHPAGEELAPTVPLADLDKTPDDLLNLDIRAITDPNSSTSANNNAPVLISSFEINRLQSEHVRKACSDKGFPILEEYDFRNDTTLPTLDISLRPAAILRPYQEKSLNKMFGNGRARSGIIVLPCGAGKTLVGVTAACTVKKRVLVLCTSAVSVEQWAREFRSWTNIKDNEVAKFTSQHKELLANDNGILISTYTMVTFSSKRAYDAQKMMDYICSREWGLLILDEVHVVPAEMFRKVLTIVAAHSKLGLTATLVREDDKIGNLNYLIGPKLYEANWLDLAKKGHIANVRCSEVWCTMTKEFYKEYLGQSSRKRQLLYVMNPNKIQACQYLIDFHEQRGDKVIVFSDNVFALKHYATKLNRPYIYGGSSTADRLRTLQQFKYNPSLNTIFLSKVGDTSIDIPEASCLIQISSHYGSRRQEAQRLGRILRAKKGSNGGDDGGYNSFFYTLVSRDTEEVYYCAKRQQFLIDQGYSYDIITKMEGMETVAPLVYRTINERLELLATILVSNDMIDLSQIEDADEDEDARGLYAAGGGFGSSSSLSGGTGSRFSQSTATMKSLSGADNMAYIEQTRGGLSAEFRKRRKQ